MFSGPVQSYKGAIPYSFFLWCALRGGSAQKKSRARKLCFLPESIKTPGYFFFFATAFLAGAFLADFFTEAAATVASAATCAAARHAIGTRNGEQLT